MPRDPSHTDRRGFQLQVRQQPERARLCSFKEENDTIDRRPVDPPPVVELLVPRENTSSVYESTTYFIRASIVHPQSTVSPRGEEDFLPVKTPTGADATAGEVIQTPERLKNLDGTFASLVIFAKLSVRMPGIFRLKFTLYDTTKFGVDEISWTVSEPFEVFSPKLFKGMRESTALTRHLAAQGLKVKLRTDTTVGRQSDSRKRPSQKASAARSAPTSPNSSPLMSKLSATQSASPAAMSHSGAHGNASASSRSQSSGLAPIRHPGPVHYSSAPYTIPPHRSLSPTRFKSAPPPPPGGGLVWHSSMNSRYPEPSSSRGPSPVPYSVGRLRGDDGTIPHLRDISRFDYTPSPPSADLSAFSLSVDHNRRPDSQSTKLSSSSRSSPFSPFSLSSSSSNTLTTPSTRPTSPPGTETLAPIIWPNRPALAPGDDGIPVLPSFLRPLSSPSGSGTSGHILPPPLPSFMGSQAGAGPPVVGMLPPVLPSLRDPPVDLADQPPKRL